MYIPHANAEHRPETMLDFIESRAFGALVTASPSTGLFATHLPLVLDRARGELGVLEGHVARGNPHHQLSLAEGDALVIFQGADAYVTPSWYAAKAEHGRVVPTWNYVAVHAAGICQLMTDDSALLGLLAETASTYESGLPNPWSFEMGDDFVRKLLPGIVGFRIPIDRLEGKAKLNQNHPPERRERVAAALERSADPDSLAIAKLMRGGSHG